MSKRPSARRPFHYVSVIKQDRMLYKLLNLRMSAVILLCLVLLPVRQAHALVNLEGDVDSVSVAPEMLYFEDQTGSQSFFQAQSQFKRFEGTAPPHDSPLIQLSRQGSVYWLKLTINNSTDKKNWMLHFEPVQDVTIKPVWLDEITVYQNDDVGKPIYTTKNNYIPLNLTVQQTNDYLIMIKTVNGLDASFRPVLETEQDFAAYQRDEDMKVTLGWIVISIFATTALIFFALTRLSAFMVFAVYTLIFVQGSMLSIDFGKKLYNLLLTVLSPIQIMPFVAGIMSLAAVILTMSSVKDKALPFLLKLLLISLMGITIGSFFALDTLATLPISVQLLAKCIQLVTGLILAVTALSQSFQDAKNLWLIPAWLIFGIQAFVSVLNPLFFPFVHLSLLGLALVVQIYTLWQEQEKVRYEQQQRLQMDMNQMRQQHEKRKFHVGAQAGKRTRPAQQCQATRSVTVDPVS